MDGSVTIQDNFLTEDLFDAYVACIDNNDFCWNWVGIVGDDQFVSHPKYNRQLVHMFYPKPNLYNHYFNFFETLLFQFHPKIKKLIRMKLNCIPRTHEIIRHGFHTDTDEKCKTSILYMNTNNGFTEFETGEIVESVANRLVTFDSSIKHLGTTCTDSVDRRVLNINWE